MKTSRVLFGHAVYVRTLVSLQFKEISSWKLIENFIIKSILSVSSWFQYIFKLTISKYVLYESPVIHDQLFHIYVVRFYVMNAFDVKSCGSDIFCVIKPELLRTIMKDYVVQYFYSLRSIKKDVFVGLTDNIPCNWGTLNLYLSICRWCYVTITVFLLKQKLFFSIGTINVRRTSSWI